MNTTILKDQAYALVTQALGEESSFTRSLVLLEAASHAVRAHALTQTASDNSPPPTLITTDDTDFNGVVDSVVQGWKKKFPAEIVEGFFQAGLIGVSAHTNIGQHSVYGTGPSAYRRVTLPYRPFCPQVGETLSLPIRATDGRLYEARLSDFDGEFYVVHIERVKSADHWDLPYVVRRVLATGKDCLKHVPNPLAEDFRAAYRSLTKGGIRVIEGSVWNAKKKGWGSL